jgi:hypothetical protein
LLLHTRVTMIDEASSMSGGELPRVARMQVGEDLARAAEDPPVLRLQDGDLVGAGRARAAASAAAAWAPLGG